MQNVFKKRPMDFEKKLKRNAEKRCEKFLRKLPGCQQAGSIQVALIGTDKLDKKTC